MSLEVKTAEQVATDNLAVYESTLNQDSPLNDKAFLRVISGQDGLTYAELQVLSLQRAKQALVTTADRAGLIQLGIEFEAPIKTAKKAQLQLNHNAVNGTIIKAGTIYSGNDNGILYTADQDATAVGGIAVVQTTANTATADGNLAVGKILSLQQQIAGAESIATVESVIELGSDDEKTEDYRRRLLIVVRAVLGGGNATEHRIWSEEVPGVFRTYPYSGLPEGVMGTSYPGIRTVYIEADTTIDPDGIPTQAILDAARDYLNNDPDDGRQRPPLGTTDENLYVEPIIRTAFFLEIEGLTVDPALEDDLKADIEAGSEIFFRTIKPFVPAIDLAQDKNDTVTAVAVSSTIQDILTQYGASATAVRFGTSFPTPLPEYTLAKGELSKLDSVTYV